MTNKSLNFLEWMFIRKCAVAWCQSNSRQTVVSKVELLDIGFTILAPYNLFISKV